MVEYGLDEEIAPCSLLTSLKADRWSIELRSCALGALRLTQSRRLIYDYIITDTVIRLQFVNSLYTMRPILLQGHVSAEIQPK